MKCPACSKELVNLEVSDLKVDICKTGCGGIWFDNFEIKKVDEEHESLGEILLEESLKNISDDKLKDQKRQCPRCANISMMRHYYTVRKEVEVDECPNCGGVWLDVGELAAIRKQFKTVEQKQQAADQYFSKLFDKHLASAASESKQDMEKKQKFARALRFVTPSYWIPGKQSGGAF